MKSHEAKKRYKTKAKRRRKQRAIKKLNQKKERRQ
jgi:hypothetical protein